MPQPEFISDVEDPLVQAYRSAWQRVVAEQERIADDPRKYARRARLRETQKAIETAMDEVDLLTERWVAEQFPKVYAAGAVTPEAVADMVWTSIHENAVQNLSQDLFTDLLEATMGVRQTTKDLIREIGRNEALQSTITGGTAKKAGAEMAKLLKEQGICAVVYKDGSRHGLQEYAEMAMRTKTATAYNHGTLNQHDTQYWEVFDGPGCGWSFHESTDQALGSIRPKDECFAYPISHPNCRRAFGPRPDIVSQAQIDELAQNPLTAGAGQVNIGQVAAQVEQDKATRTRQQARRAKRQARLAKRAPQPPSARQAARVDRKLAREAAIDERLPPPDWLLQDLLPPSSVDAYPSRESELKVLKTGRYKGVNPGKDWRLLEDPNERATAVWSWDFPSMEAVRQIDVNMRSGLDAFDGVALDESNFAVKRWSTLELTANSKGSALDYTIDDYRNDLYEAARRLGTQLDGAAPTESPLFRGMWMDDPAFEFKVGGSIDRPGLTSFTGKESEAQGYSNWWAGLDDTVGKQAPPGYRVVVELEPGSNALTLDNWMTGRMDGTQEALTNGRLEITAVTQEGDVTRVLVRQVEPMGPTAGSGELGVALGEATDAQRLKAVDKEIAEARKQRDRDIYGYATSQATKDRVDARIAYLEGRRAALEGGALPPSSVAFDDYKKAAKVAGPKTKGQLIKEAVDSGDKYPEVLTPDLGMAYTPGPKPFVVDDVVTLDRVSAAPVQDGFKLDGMKTNQDSVRADFVQLLVDEPGLDLLDDEDALIGLTAAEAKLEKLLQKDPVVVRKDGDLWLVDGHHRATARSIGSSTDTFSAKFIDLDAPVGGAKTTVQAGKVSSAPIVVKDGKVLSTYNKKDDVPTALELIQAGIDPGAVAAEHKRLMKNAGNVERRARDKLAKKGGAVNAKAAKTPAATQLPGKSATGNPLEIGPGPSLWASRIWNDTATDEWIPVRGVTVQGRKVDNGMAFKRNGIAYMVEARPGQSVGEMQQELLSLAKGTEDALEAVPKELWPVTKGVVHMKGKNPQDAYWAKKYNTPGFTSAATGGDGTVTYWNSSPNLGTTLHETGHNLDQHFGTGGYHSWVSDQKPWADAQNFDANASSWLAEQTGVFVPHTGGGLTGKPITPGKVGPTKYGQTNAHEDWAESTRLFFIDRTPHKPSAYSGVDTTLGLGVLDNGLGQPVTVRFQDLWPERYQILCQTYGITPDDPLTDYAKATRAGARDTLKANMKLNGGKPTVSADDLMKSDGWNGYAKTTVGGKPSTAMEDLIADVSHEVEQELAYEAAQAAAKAAAEAAAKKLAEEQVKAAAAKAAAEAATKAKEAALKGTATGKLTTAGLETKDKVSVGVKKSNALKKATAEAKAGKVPGVDAWDELQVKAHATKAAEQVEQEAIAAKLGLTLGEVNETTNGGTVVALAGGRPTDGPASMKLAFDQLPELERRAVSFTANKAYTQAVRDATSGLVKGVDKADPLAVERYARGVYLRKKAPLLTNVDAATLSAIEQELKTFVPPQPGLSNFVEMLTGAQRAELDSKLKQVAIDAQQEFLNGPGTHSLAGSEAFVAGRVEEATAEFIPGKIGVPEEWMRGVLSPTPKLSTLLDDLDDGARAIVHQKAEAAYEEAYAEYVNFSELSGNDLDQDVLDAADLIGQAAKGKTLKKQLAAAKGVSVDELEKTLNPKYATVDELAAAVGATDQLGAELAKLADAVASGADADLAKKQALSEALGVSVQDVEAAQAAGGFSKTVYSKPAMQPAKSLTDLVSQHFHGEEWELLMEEAADQGDLVVDTLQLEGELSKAEIQKAADAAHDEYLKGQVATVTGMSIEDVDLLIKGQLPKKAAGGASKTVQAVAKPKTFEEMASTLGKADRDEIARLKDDVDWEARREAFAGKVKGVDRLDQSAIDAYAAEQVAIKVHPALAKKLGITPTQLNKELKYHLPDVTKADLAFGDKTGIGLKKANAYKKALKEATERPARLSPEDYALYGSLGADPKRYAEAKATQVELAETQLRLDKLRAERGIVLESAGGGAGSGVMVAEFRQSENTVADKWVKQAGRKQRQGVPQQTSTAAQAKANLSRELASRLDTAEDWDDMNLARAARGQPALTYSDYSAEGRTQEMEQEVSVLVGQWAAESGDSNARSLMMQMAARDEFGTADTVFAACNSTQVRQESAEIYKKAGPFARKMLRRMYEHTQEEFKAAGIERVTVWRGMRFNEGNRPDWARPGVHQPQFQPINSWSTQERTARGFGPTMFRSSVPVDRIVGSARTGFGCLNEQEFVVLDSIGEAIVDYR